MKTWLCLCLASMFGGSALPHHDAAEVTRISVEHRYGQTFVTWKDVTAGEAGAGNRYRLYRSDKLITAENLSKAELCYGGIFNNFAKRYGSAFTRDDPLAPEKPYAVFEEGGEPLSVEPVLDQSFPLSFVPPFFGCEQRLCLQGVVLLRPNPAGWSPGHN